MVPRLAWKEKITVQVPEGVLHHLPGDGVAVAHKCAECTQPRLLWHADLIRSMRQQRSRLDIQRCRKALELHLLCLELDHGLLIGLSLAQVAALRGGVTATLVASLWLPARGFGVPIICAAGLLLRIRPFCRPRHRWQLWHGHSATGRFVTPAYVAAPLGIAAVPNACFAATASNSPAGRPCYSQNCLDLRVRWQAVQPDL
mmetsp:Transcript_41666/g.107877  ORF Transcript_41666/g.107877 Transcript_41666/m.107877 type:complete len:201 (-) Transcript_41666:46-648(-)